ncbi:MAG: flavodoxin [Candidatus Solincola sediminis]|uniref:Flavodoxin n=1 Tax=Candidatus Solincola sediminis TaxID=1797199 RepID=A0A1F2WQD3_9ACTN|nr:MAG: flavodoxin [Candidatus Solincola sediminis]OFW61442.1 MAG: flavodoxin [Candidatus Solincola sediminis]
MKTLVTYFSQTGQTRKVADAIFEQLPGDKEIKPFDQVENLDGYGLTFIGFPIIAFGPAPPAKDFLAAKANGKQVALFITHAAPESDERVGEWLDRCREAASQSELIGLFDCMGELSEQIADYLLKSDDPMMRSYGERRQDTVGQPDSTRLKQAGEFAKETIDKVKG